MSEKKEKRKRNRIPLACAVCRARKFKCDRVRPVCSSCIAHNTEILCEYAEPLWKAPLRKSSKGVTVEVEHKIDRKNEQKTEHEMENKIINHQKKNLNPFGMHSENNEKNSSYISSIEEQNAQLKNEIFELKNKLLLLTSPNLSANVESNVNTNTNTDTNENKNNTTDVNTNTTFESNANTDTNIDLNGSRSNDWSCNNNENFSSLKQKNKSLQDLNTIPDLVESCNSHEKKKKNIDFHSKTAVLTKPSKTIYYGPTSWGWFVRHDVAISKLLKTVSSAKLHCKKFDFILSNRQGCSPFPQGSHLKGKYKSSGGLYCNCDYTEGFIIKKIPFYELGNSLINVFMRYVYPLFPFVNETSVREKFSRITSLNLQGKYRLISDDDYLDVALLFIIFRHASIASHSIALKKYSKLSGLILSEVEIEYFEMTKYCINKIDYLRNSRLLLVQVLLYVRLHLIYSPEDGDGGDGSHGSILLGLITQIAIATGLHRDPSRNPALPIDDYEIWRKTWYFIKHLDSKQATFLGRMPILPDDYYDTKFPTLPNIDNYGNIESITEDLRDYSERNFKLYFEYEFVVSLKLNEEVDKLIRKFTRRCFSLTSKVSICEVYSFIQEMNNFIKIKLRPIGELLNSYRSSINIFTRYSALRQISVYLIITRLKLTLFASLFLLLDFHKLEKELLSLLDETLICFKSFVNVLTNILRIVSSQAPNTNEGEYDWFIIPIVIECSIISLMVSASLHSRSTKMKETGGCESERHNNNSHTIMSLLFDFKALLTELSSEYYSAFRLVTILSAVINVLEENLNAEGSDKDFPQKLSFDTTNQSDVTNNIMTNNQLSKIEPNFNRNSTNIFDYPILTNNIINDATSSVNNINNNHGFIGTQDNTAPINSLNNSANNLSFDISSLSYDIQSMPIINGRNIDFDAFMHNSELFDSDDFLTFEQ